MKDRGLVRGGQESAVEIRRPSGGNIASFQDDKSGQILDWLPRP